MFLGKLLNRHNARRLFVGVRLRANFDLQITE